MTSTTSDDGRLARARQETRSYHDEYYRNHSLFGDGSWLKLPDKAIASLIPKVAEVTGARALDLGCGVGRNAIPLAQAGIHVTCIDCLPVAIEMLNQYARERHLERFISAQQQPIEDFPGSPGSFNLVLAISALEHTASLDKVSTTLDRIIRSTANGGYHLLTVSTDRRVVHAVTGDAIETFVETPMSEQHVKQLLTDKYTGWSILDSSSELYEERLQHQGEPVIWSSTEVRWLARSAGQPR